MRRLCRAGRVAAALVSLASALLQPASFAAEPEKPHLFLPFSYPPDGSGMMGEAFAGSRSGVTTPLIPPTGKQSHGIPPVKSQAVIMDDLLLRLAHAENAEEAEGLATRIAVLWLRSGSDTADLLMSHARQAFSQGRTDVALELLDRLITLEPDWAEAWNQRALIRVTTDDDPGAMEDIAHALRLEPRQFIALGSMAMLLRRQGMKKDALAIFRRAAAIDPFNADLQHVIEQLTPDVEGRPT